MAATLETYKKTRKTRNTFWGRHKVYIMWAVLVVFSVGVLLVQRQKLYDVGTNLKLQALDILGQTNKARLDKIAIYPTRNVKEGHIRDKVGPYFKKSLYALPLEALKNELSMMPWAEAVQLRVRYPDTLEIRITEKTPAFRWQKSPAVFVALDKQLEPIVEVPSHAFEELPLIVGRRANKHAQDIRLIVKALQKKNIAVKGYVLGKNGTWQLHAREGAVILLPDVVDESFIRFFFELVNDYDILRRKLQMVDLRFNGKIIVRPAVDNPVTNKREQGKI